MREEANECSMMDEVRSAANEREFGEKEGKWSTPERGTVTKKWKEERNEPTFLPIFRRGILNG